MDYINYVKQYPMSMGGLGGPVGALNFHHTASGGGNTGFYGARGIFATGYGAYVEQDVIDYVSIDTTGNFTDFGNLQVARRAGGCVTGDSASRMCIGGGYDGQTQHEGSTMQDIIGYIATASTGNASDFGDLTVKRYAVSACGSSDRGVWCFGQQQASPSYTDIMDYITISSTGNATDFGDTQYPARSVFAMSNGVRGICGGGTPNTDGINYFTIDTTGNASDFGNLTSTMGGYQAAASGDTDNSRGIIAGGQSMTNEIQYITITSTGNAQDFGDMVNARQGGGACSNGTRFITGGGGVPSSPATDEVEYVTVANTGNGTDFGDLTVGRWYTAASSGNAS